MIDETILHIPLGVKPLIHQSMLQEQSSKFSNNLPMALKLRVRETNLLL
jgi:hypothetical protein